MNCECESINSSGTAETEGNLHDDEEIYKKIHRLTMDACLIELEFASLSLERT